MESVAVIAWNGWPECYGISGRNGVEYTDSPSLDIDALKGREGFRLRVGQYRAIYTRQDDQLIIEVVKIRPRGDIYKR